MSDIERLYAWRKAHPDLLRRQNRLKSARRRQATVALRERHREEYDALVAAEHEALDYRPYTMRTYRQAERALRLNHPEEWRDLLSHQSTDQ